MLSLDKTYLLPPTITTECINEKKEQLSDLHFYGSFVIFLTSPNYD